MRFTMSPKRQPYIIGIESDIYVITEGILMIF